MNNWLEYTFTPAAFEAIDLLLPSMQFTRNQRGGWHSPYKLDSTTPAKPRRDKTYITAAKPHLVGEQGGDTITVVELYRRLNGLASYGEALRAMAGTLGLAVPSNNTYTKATPLDVERLEAITHSMANALLSHSTPAAQRVWDYLQQGRGYTSEYIELAIAEAQLGYIDTDTANTIKGLLHTDTNNANAWPSGIGTTYTLAIPYRSNGRIVGYGFRSTEPTNEPKYKYAFAAGYSQTKALYGLKPLPYKANDLNLRPAVVVEGQLDAIRANIAGITNVVAAGGLNIGTEAITAAKRRGIDTLILLLDNDQSGKATANIERAATNIATAGLRCYIADLPAGAKDIDEYLTKGGNIEAVKGAIHTAIPVAVHLYNHIIDTATRGGGDLTHTDLEGQKRRILQLCTQPYTSPTDKGAILHYYSAATGQHYTIEALNEELNAATAEATAEHTKQGLKAATGEAIRLADAGDITKAIEGLQAKLTDLQQAQHANDYEAMLTPPTPQALFESLTKQRGGIPTQYALKYRNGDTLELTLPVGLTYVCGLAGHGKSRLLLNLALHQAQQRAGAVLYFTFEETAAAVTLQALNMAAGLNLSANNLKTLNSYYTTGETGYFAGNRDGKGKAFTDYKESEKATVELITQGHLKILATDNSVSTVIGAIRYAHRQQPIRAVFIDYVQLMKIDNTRLQRREELATIAQQLWQTANALNVPIVLAAQLNRQAHGPTDLYPQNMAESADLERSANTIVALWNSDYKPNIKESTYYTNSKGEYSDEAAHIEGLGLNIGSKGRIYAKLLKCRYAAPNAEAVLNFDGNTGRIEQGPIDTITIDTDTRPYITD